MATESTPPARPARIVNWLGLALVGVLVLAALLWRDGASSSALRPTDELPSVGTGAASRVLESLPLPEGYSGTVLDAATYPGELAVGPDVAVERARSNLPDLVGSDPLVRLMRVTKSGPDPSETIDGVFWVVLSPDVDVPITGPYGVDTSGEVYTTYSWVFVDVKGEVVMITGRSYLLGEASPPELPSN